jgi:hypothetical protein
MSSHRTGRWMSSLDIQNEDIGSCDLPRSADKGFSFPDLDPRRLLWRKRGISVSQTIGKPLPLVYKDTV